MRLLLILAGSAALSAAATAGTVRLEFNQVYGDDDDAPLSDGPWIIATFDDLGSDRVLLTIENLLSSESEHVKQINFNLNPIFDAGDLVIEQRSGGAQAERARSIENAFDAGSAKEFDIEIEWKDEKHDRFEGGSGAVVEFELSGLSGLSAESFLFLNAGNEHDSDDEHEKKFFAAAHIGGFGDDDDSAWVAPESIPLPSSVYLIGAGLVLVPAVRRGFGHYLMS